MPSSRRAPAADANAPPGPRTLKKYPNRRLYDTRSSSYITLADVKRMVLAGEEFEVRDAKSGDDLTRSILLQIILEEESGGVPTFSTPMLSQIIRFYGSAMQGPMGAMLEQNLQAFVEMQKQFVGGQAPVLQNLMAGYLDQSRAVFEAMQDQMAVFGRFPPGKR
ncbi:polyhydroxyalkanoate synthesis repressor PhaR [Rubrivivax gelatinosus]|uniref:Polyhydroxyalkanoate synthesis repressor PhaR n=1 Tax=Rubrivivax gelatinosus TaxID=28068 RepID=A0ABS1DRJ5_RUBGE|nr:polyhydroxyalkanoate synthesis repressor PhaR [Rubrivivax gelatinosus]MBK1615588.1 polyhydroxyalkanoate synthesis repressor PhaR [Rubrivivax gelatinosus]MBK1712118.1 polyhydroxyalkanoate synthesis repressor PhaR [Rubrivivax gelatinosus]